MTAVTKKQKKNTFNKIRQCRPDREYTNQEYKNIGFFNKNRNYNYTSYSDNTSISFILSNFGEYVRDVYNSINIPQARSDFFLIASLYCEGGVSADVCSTCTASIDYLIKNEKKLHLVKDSNGFQKKFLYASPYNKIIGDYLNHLLEKFLFYRKNNLEIEYENFSSQSAFDSFIKSEIVGKRIGDDDLVIIDSDSYNSIITNDLSEEVLLNYSSDKNKKVSIRGILGNYKGFSPPKYNRILGSMEGGTMLPNGNYYIIGENKHPLITKNLNYTVNTPDIELYKIPNVTVSGHCCIWKDNTFLRLESYLSTVAEEEMEAGFWKSPSELPASVSLDQETILSFGAGYGCYGHYLVDEIPRLAFTKEILGSENFHKKKILIPYQTPEWGIDLLKFFLEIQEENIVKFDHRESSVDISSAIIPTYLHKNYQFHPFVKEFFGFYKNNSPEKVPYRRICLSRKSWERNKANQRIFLQQDLFEQIAISRGFEIILPETLSLIDQINLLRETRCQVGEHGSAQHASIYNSRGSTIGTINPLTEIQCNLGRLYNDSNIIAFAQDEYKDENNNTFYSLSEQKIIEFFDEVERKDEKRKYEDQDFVVRSFDSVR
ncbi:glycosyltransferase 61 family protein [Gluconobacter cerinus]|uniref:glycosyltransferase 61 family protein n=1 Tax=Gluconobacter cerinus TaxID=38307 RepID=UPI001B8D5EDA|nr:glycosyltransferase 61 family protein [Gluconobacter cerinus]MBS0995942.1 glycosyltransferase family 61 protein [Gluconobacter cerinus]